eukprot:scaffold69127_cov36-Phaeocystis_antarctica.AAC.1
MAAPIRGACACARLASTASPPNGTGAAAAAACAAASALLRRCWRSFQRSNIVPAIAGAGDRGRAGGGGGGRAIAGAGSAAGAGGGGGGRAIAGAGGAASATFAGTQARIPPRPLCGNFVSDALYLSFSASGSAFHIWPTCFSLSELLRPGLVTHFSAALPPPGTVACAVTRPVASAMPGGSRAAWPTRFLGLQFESPSGSEAAGAATAAAQAASAAEPAAVAAGPAAQVRSSGGAAAAASPPGSGAARRAPRGAAPPAGAAAAPGRARCRGSSSKPQGRPPRPQGRPPRPLAPRAPRPQPRAARARRGGSGVVGEAWWWERRAWRASLVGRRCHPRRERRERPTVGLGLGLG